MKNYSNIYKTLLFLVVILATACSSDDSESDSTNTEMKLLSTLTDDRYEQGNSIYIGKDTLVYQNGKIIKSFLTTGCGIRASQYEYGNNGKISKIYELSPDPMGSVTIEDLIYMFESSTLDDFVTTPSLLEYDSENRLISVDMNGYYIDFKYDDKGRLFKKITSDNITFIVHEFDEKGNPLYVTRNYGGSVSDEYYTYGDLKNPYYDLFQNYGLLFLDCPFETTFITPNVVTVFQSKRYTYYSEGDYPSSVILNHNGSTSVYEFSYR